MFIANIKSIESFELEKFYHLLTELRTPVAGLVNKRIYKAIAKEALKNENIVIVIAKDEEEVIGCNITVVDWKHFWSKFFRSYPHIAIEIFFKRAMKRVVTPKTKMAIENKDKIIDQYLAITPTDRSWNDSSPQIAKTIYTGVHNKFRKKGIGKKISTYRNSVLKDRGVKRLDTNLSRTNLPIIKMNYSIGYKIYRDGSRLFGTIDL